MVLLHAAIFATAASTSATPAAPAMTMLLLGVHAVFMPQFIGLALQIRLFLISRRRRGQWGLR